MSKLYKKIGATIIAFLMAVILLPKWRNTTVSAESSNIWSGSIATQYDGGTGTQADPFQIATGEQLAYLAQQVNNGEKYVYKSFILTKDIVLNEDINNPVHSWIPIGIDTNHCFFGLFDGKGHTISGIYANRELAGLFGWLKGTVQNVGIINSYINGTCAGSIAGYAQNQTGDNKIINCYNTSTIIGRIPAGIVGYNIEYPIKDCYNVGTISGECKGAIIGYNGNGSVTNCYYLNSCGASGLGISKTSEEMKLDKFLSDLNSDDDIFMNDILNENNGYPILKSRYNILISCDNITYGETPNPQVILNNIGGEVTYEYKIQGADDSTYSPQTPINVGDYTARANQGHTATADFTINKAVLNVITSNISILTGEELPTFDVIITGFKNEENEDLTGFEKPAVNHNLTDTTIVGEYPLTISGGNPTDNYEFSYQNDAKLTINTKIDASVPIFTTDLSGETTYTKDEAVADLEVEATVSDGGTISYQWYNNSENNSTTGTEISGETSAKFTPLTTTVGTTYYYVIATNTNDSVNGTKTATATSGIAKIAVNETPVPDPIPDPTPDVKPDTTFTPNPHNKTTTTAKISDIVQSLKDGDNLTIKPTTKNKSLSGDILKQIKGKDIDVKVEITDGIEWSFNAKDIPENWTLKDINFGIDTKNSNIPSDIINSIKSENKSILANLSYNGEFGFEMQLSIHIGYLDNGKIANLYYYNPQTKELEFMQSNQINSGGNAKFKFTHASDYVILVADEAVTTLNTTTTTDNGTTTDSAETNPVTGNTLPAGIIITSLATAFIITKKKFIK